jgi:protein-disulfide isomerase
MFKKSSAVLLLLTLTLALTACGNATVGSIDNTGAPFLGEEKAPVALTEFSDFECPACAQAASMVHKLANELKGKVKIYYRNFPLPQHAYARLAAEAGQCAFEQNKFWEMHDTLFKNQLNFNKDKMKEYAKNIGLDEQKFNGCLDSGKYADKVEADYQEALRLGLSGTPSFILNNQKLTNLPSYEALKALVEEEAKK